MYEKKISLVNDLKNVLHCYVESNILWIIDRAQEKKNNKTPNLFLLFILAILFTLFKFSFRFIFAIIKTNFGHRLSLTIQKKCILFFEFSSTHRKALEQLKNRMYDITYPKYFSYRSGFDYFHSPKNCLFVDDYVTIRVITNAFGEVLSKNSYNSVCKLQNILVSNDLELSLMDTFKLFTKNFDSIFFRQLLDTPNLDFLKHNIIFFGNDTCYRSFWLIQNNLIKTITIQHGIISNRLMYYSRSDIFLYWDEKSFSLLPKSSHTTYVLVGCPLNPPNIQICVKSDSVLFILTKYLNPKVYSDIVSFSKNFNNIVCIKLHPNEDLKIIKYLSKQGLYIIENYESKQFVKVFVFDSTVAFELSFSDIESVYAVTCFPHTKANTFSYYFNASYIHDLLNNDLSLDSISQLEMKSSFFDVSLIRSLISPHL